MWGDRIRYGEFNPDNSDGCTLLSFVNRLLLRPPLSFRHCCVDHDRDYWYGGTSKMRKESDIRLRRCVLNQTGNNLLAWTMYIAVRFFGSPRLPTPWRWAKRVTIIEGMVRGYSAGRDSEGHLL